MKKIIIIFYLFIFSASIIFAGTGKDKTSETGINKFTISGYVKAANSGEALIGATVSIKEMATTGSVTNAYGFYSITIPEGKYTVLAQFIGYETKSVTIDLKQNTRQDFNIDEKTNNYNIFLYIFYTFQYIFIFII